MTISGTSLHRKSDNEWRFVRDLQNVAPKTTYGFCAFPWAAGTGSGGYVANIDSEHTCGFGRERERKKTFKCRNDCVLAVSVTFQSYLALKREVADFFGV
eukprot:GEMP01056898.1.p1 GENE.GEMP01056898.1~~GEMP01056898.1.p1  ORF type:complete len:100 (-),score=12.16 GEMP01056898.1:808-1107(-)